MNEIPQDDGSAVFEVSDSDLGIKTIRLRDGDAVRLGRTWYRNGEMEQ